jgi:citrate synthase
MGWSTPDRITVRGHDLVNELIGKISLGDMAWLEITGKMPDAAQSLLFNAIMVTLVEHGMTPSAIATRMTYLGAPEAMNAAVAAGLCGMGSVFVGTPKARRASCNNTGAAATSRPWRRPSWPITAHAKPPFRASVIRSTSRSTRAPHDCSSWPRNRVTTALPAN